MLKLLIMGTRGIPANYSGFETSVEETSTRFVKYDYDVTVICRSSYYKNKLNNYNGVKLKYVPSIRTKHLDTVTSTLFSIFYIIINKYDIVILYGIGNAFFLPILKFLGKKVISVVDGADWRRSKWNPFVMCVLFKARYISVRYSDYYIVDNELLVLDYKKQFKKPPFYIPYGAKIPDYYNEDILNEFGLEKNKYIIFIGRFVKEKGIEFLIKNFIKIDTDVKLLIVGGNYNDKSYENKIKELKHNSVIFAGFVFGDKCDSLLKFAKLYVSCSFLEGTSPSLLSAMAINGFALVSDLPENLEVLKGSCSTFITGNENDFINKLSYLLSYDSEIETEREKTKSVIEKYYTWDRITEQYLTLFNKILNPRNKIMNKIAN
ncbi:MAG: glycosyltransferase [Bacilli bacterium]|jgi:glycosyltransferase involved in cell wall biosynthesis